MLNVTVGRGKNQYREGGVPEGLFEEVRPKGTSLGKGPGGNLQAEGTVCAKALRQAGASMDAEAQPGGLRWNRGREEERRRKWGWRSSKHTDEQGRVATARASHAP